MAKTCRRTWQKFEQRVAAFFGHRRNPGSGCGMTDTRSDSNHPDLFIEAKLRKESPIHKLFGEVSEKAAQEGKTPILALQWKNHAGWLLVCRPEHIHLLSSLAKDYDRLPNGKEPPDGQTEEAGPREEAQARDRGACAPPACGEDHGTLQDHGLAHQE